jgi:alpha/beta superfamily hydrolase
MTRLPGAGTITPVTFSGAAGAIEGILAMPVHPPLGVAVVCHPHPLHGGTMDNKVAYTLARSCTDAGLAALRFNFRGVGGSAGQHDQGAGETGDTLRAVDWLMSATGAQHFVLAGFSFGGFVALQAAMRRAPLQLVTIAPPLAYLGDAPVPRPACPWLVVHGEADEVVDCADTVARLATLQPPVEVQVLAGVGHFFHGQLGELKRRIVPVLQERLAGIWQRSGNSADSGYS